MPVGDIFKLTVNGLVNGDPQVNTFYYIESVNPGTGGDQLALMQGWQALIQPSYLASVTTRYALLNYACYRVFPTVSALLKLNVIAGNGTVTGASMPENVAAVISKRTSQPGRSGRGRIFMPAVPATYVSTDGTIWSDTGLGQYEALASLLVEVIVQAGFQFIPVVFNKRKPLATSFWNPITNLVVNGVPRQQRRREFGVRIHPRKKAAVARVEDPERSAQLQEFANKWRAEINRPEQPVPFRTVVESYGKTDRPMTAEGATNDAGRAKRASKGGQQ